MKNQLIFAVIAAGALAGGCSYTEHTTAAAPAPAPQPVAVAPASSTQQTVYRDSYTGKPLASSTTVTTR